MRIRNAANTLGSRGDGSIHASHYWFWCSGRHRGWGGSVPDVPASDSRANNAQLSQHRQRSLVSIPPVAGQSPSAGVAEIKTVPYVPLSHPFVERLVGTLRRECLDRALFWAMTDPEGKLFDFQHYYNENPTPTGCKGPPPEPGVNVDRSLVNLSCYRWQKHCRGLYQTPIAA